MVDRSLMVRWVIGLIPPDWTCCVCVCGGGGGIIKQNVLSSLTLHMYQMCFTSGVTNAVVCTILSVGWLI